jgi:purine-binding chemotaxis protein CheW
MTDYVTFTTAGQLFGLPIEYVQDVFTLANITPVPLAGPEIAGVLNLRGRVVTVIDLANRLQLEAPRDATAPMVIGIERGAESLGILVDRAGEVLSWPTAIATRPRSISTARWTLQQPGYSGSTRKFLSRLMPIGCWISAVRGRSPRSETDKCRNALSNRPERADRVRTI